MKVAKALSYKQSTMVGPHDRHSRLQHRTWFPKMSMLLEMNAAKIMAKTMPKFIYTWKLTESISPLKLIVIRFKSVNHVSMMVFSHHRNRTNTRINICIIHFPKVTRRHTRSAIDLWRVRYMIDNWSTASNEWKNRRMNSRIAPTCPTEITSSWSRSMAKPK